MNIHDKYQFLLNKHNITNYKVAKDTGISITALRYFKIGKSTLKIDKLKILANYFGVSIDYFLDEQIQSNTITLQKNDEMNLMFEKLNKQDKQTVKDFMEFILYKKYNNQK